ncbi:hypothetical protein CYY_003627 [Polysphondylium violaceum]|uniref:FNIP repeat-containing protein n=1 Tax=Polysphondylium violaceum TaxID=133409 RepID=A0A8J4V028_9MYCE|nr:hypothetical protein CYY_003627 [Polysphondylium violaceum]
MTESFYLIWRNQYIRQLIRNIFCQNFIINVSKEYLIEKHQDLSVFSSQDKLDHNITILFKGRAGDYLDIDHSIRDVINEVDLDLKWDDSFDLNEIHDGVHKLSLKREKDIYTPDDTITIAGQLPSSITYLYLSSECPSLVQPLLSNLPANLQELELDIQQNSLSGPCIMPQSLTKLKSSPYLYYENLKWFVVPPNKVYKSCKAYVDSIESFEWLFANKWICNVEIDPNIVGMLMAQHKLPAHVTKLEMFIHDDNIVPDASFIPQTLESLTCGYGIPISHFAHLKSLTIAGDYPIKLEKGVLPESLQKLCLYYNQPLEADVLPPHLTALSLYKYDQPLYPNVLPPGLTSLFLNNYNQPLYINVLPSSLTNLNLAVFNQPLNPFVLPSKLKTLYLGKFITNVQPILPPNSLPTSLTSLSIFEFNGSFDQCQPLDNLKTLKVYSLVPSLATLLANVKKLYIWVFNIGVRDPSSMTCLYNTSIKSLQLHFNWRNALSRNTFPPTLRYLTLVNANLESDDVIPSGCVRKLKYV